MKAYILKKGSINGKFKFFEQLNTWLSNLSVELPWRHAVIWLLVRDRNISVFPCMILSHKNSKLNNTTHSCYNNQCNTLFPNLPFAVTNELHSWRYNVQILHLLFEHLKIPRFSVTETLSIKPDFVTVRNKFGGCL